MSDATQTPYNEKYLLDRINEMENRLAIYEKDAKASELRQLSEGRKREADIFRHNIQLPEETATLKDPVYNIYLKDQLGIWHVHLEYWHRHLNEWQDLNRRSEVYSARLIKLANRVLLTSFGFGFLWFVITAVTLLK